MAPANGGITVSERVGETIATAPTADKLSITASNAAVQGGGAIITVNNITDDITPDSTQQPSPLKPTTYQNSDQYSAPEGGGHGASRTRPAVLQWRKQEARRLASAIAAKRYSPQAD